MVYGILTAGQRTWGGPRADAGAADFKTTPQQAIEHAIETGDDLNVVPETFKPAMESRRRRTRPSALHPSSSVEGRFVPAEPGPSHLWEKAMSSPTPSETEMGFDRRWEHHSLDMSDSEGISIHTPQRIGSFSADDRGLGFQSDGQYEDETPQRITQKAWVHRARRSTMSAPSAYRAPRELTSGVAARQRTFSLGIPDSTELSRHLNALATQQNLIDSRLEAVQRSPLGRISPLTVVAVDDGLPRLRDREASPGGQDGNEAQVVGSRRWFKQKKSE